MCQCIPYISGQDLCSRMKCTDVTKLQFLWLLLIWSQTHSVPGHLVPHNWFQEQTVPKQTHLVSMDIWSPRQMVSLDKWSPKFVSSFQKWFGTLFLLFVIEWSNLDITDDFKPIFIKSVFTFW
jgi:hypothetical protein